MNWTSPPTTKRRADIDGREGRLPVLPPLFTSRWASPLLCDLDVMPVGISRGVPRFKVSYRYKLLRLLAPSREAFEIRGDNEFDEVYVAGLEEIGMEKIAATLVRISEQHDGKPLALLCFEPVGEPCHRRVLAGWIERHLGIEAQS
jgi:Protein of unknown function, DUF488